MPLAGPSLLQAPSIKRHTVGVAVLGTGSIGMRHLNMLGRMDGVRALAVPTRAERLPELAAGGYATAQGLDEAVRSGASLCIIATDPGRHLQDGVAALARRLDVLMEKPLARNADEADRLIKQAHRTRRKLFVGCVLRFSESLTRFRELLPKIGRLHAVRIECQSYLPDWRPRRPYRDSYSARADEGGVLRDLIHEIDYAGWIFGWPNAVQACLRNLGRLSIEAEEVAHLVWETAEHAVVSINLDYLTRPSRRSMRAFGEDGTLEWDDIEGTVTLAIAGASPQRTCPSQTRDDMFRAQAIAFLQARRGTLDVRLATLEDGVRALAICDAARRASDNRREERIKYVLMKGT